MCSFVRLLYFCGPSRRCFVEVRGGEEKTEYLAHSSCRVKYELIYKDRVYICFMVEKNLFIF